MKKRYLNLARWKQTVAIFIPYCFGAAILLTLASVIFTLGNVCSFAQLNSPALDLGNLLGAALVLLISFGAGIVILFFALARWMFVLLAFSRFWLSLPASEVPDLKVLQRQAMLDIKNRHHFLTKFWLFVLLLLLVPILILCTAVGLKLASLSEIFGPQAIVLPRSVDSVLMPLAICLSICLTVISLVAVPVAAMSEGGVMQAVKQTFVLSLKKFPQAALLAALILTLNTVIASPQLLTKYAAIESYLMPSTNLQLALAEQIWQGLISTILFPLSLIPFCELLRDSISQSAKAK